MPARLSRSPALLALLGALALHAGRNAQAAPPLRATLAAAAARTIAAGSARVSFAVSGAVAGVSAGSHEQGTLSFATRTARLYRLVPGSGVPQELVFVGPILYTNANAVASLSDPTLRPWTRLDTRRLPAARRGSPNDIDQVLTLAYLSGGVADPRLLPRSPGEAPGSLHLRGLVYPAAVVARAPAPERASVREVIASTYLTRPFAADFWLDPRGRLTRVLVVYRTAGGGTIRVEGGFSSFGTRVSPGLPPAAQIEDITP